MVNIKFLSFWLLLVAGMVTIGINSCKKEDNNETEFESSAWLNTTKLGIRVGNDYELKAALVINKGDRTEKVAAKHVTWTSNNESVATVNSQGKVVAVAAGTAIITAEVDGKIKTCTVTVSIVAISNLTVSDGRTSSDGIISCRLAVGGYGSYFAYFEPSNATYQTVTWTIEDENVATLSFNEDNKYRITGVAVGETRVIVSAGEKTVIINVVVRKAPEEGILIGGIVWAPCNIDAPGTFTENPEDAGMFYQFGDNVGWSATDPMINSNDKKSWYYYVGSIQSRLVPGWRLPTKYEVERSLYPSEETACEKTTVNGVEGVKFTNKITGKFIFFPAKTGIRSWYDGRLSSGGSTYWTSDAMNSGDDYIPAIGFSFYYASYYDIYYASTSTYRKQYGFLCRCVASL